MPKRVLVCDALDDVALEVFAQRDLEASVRTGLTEEELIQSAAEFDALVVRSATRVTRAVLEAAPRLAVIGRAGVGVDNIDCDAATEHGVVVMNAPDGNTVTTAELAISLLLSLARHVPQADARVRSGSWSKKGLLGTEIAGKTLGVIGLGRIGRTVAKRGLGLAMEVLAHDPFVDAEGPAPVKGVELTGLEDLLARSDFLTLHVPLTDSTRNLLDARRLALARPGVRIVNAARGGLIDEQALLHALETRHVAGAALDVLAQEPPAPDHPLLGRDDVVLTPHLGASSSEAQARVAEQIAHQIADFLADGVPRNAVNAPAISAESLRELGPYVRLAEKMGRCLAQLAAGDVAELEVTLAGEIADRDASHVRLALLVGALAAQGDEGVNFVNAPRLAAGRGLKLTESRQEDSGSWTSYVVARAVAGDGVGAHLVGGTVFGRSPRFTRIDDVSVDLSPEGALLVTRHVDAPGVVGRIGTLLGELGVNIRAVELGPTQVEGGQVAAGFFSLYGEPAEDTADLIGRLSSVRSAVLVRL